MFRKLSLASQFTYILLFQIFLCLFFCGPSHSQVSLGYYLPEGTEYDSQIPTPKSVVGHEIGEWHLTHDKMVFYLKTLADASDRVSFEVFGQTYEGRPLVLLTISSPENLAQVEQLKANHQKLRDPSQSASLDLDKMPVVVLQGYNIHGNEPSAGNAAVLYAYYLAAAKGAEIENYLQNTVVLLDPCFNPDGFNRFASWVNMHKSATTVTDPNSREFNEVWPGARTNHYWFDLNRDWLPVQHPESRARVKKFQEWRPNILTDHHEMGKNSTFFFQPGVPSRTNPLTPAINQELTGKIGSFHAKALDTIGSLYYTKEGFDDFYYGKGSTYPDAQGSIGILFEQASSRGHAQESDHGVLTFPFTIRNQFVTSISTLEAANALRGELLAYQRDFYASASQRAASDPVKGYVFGSKFDPALNYHFLDILLHHQIDVYELGKDSQMDGKSFETGSSYVVPLDQPQYTLVKGIFDKQIDFQDSIFYDISSWTMPLAFNLPYVEMQQGIADLLGEKVVEAKFPEGKLESGASRVGYAFEWDGYYAPRALYSLLDKGVKAKVASKKFSIENKGTTKEFNFGAILIPMGIQELDNDVVFQALEKVAKENAVDIYPIKSGLVSKGVDLGSSSFKLVKKPKVMVLIDENVSSYEAGEVWFQLDQRYQIPASLVEAKKFNNVDLEEYTAIAMVSGSYTNLSNSGRQNLKNWVQKGGTLVVSKGGVNWARNNEFTKVEYPNNSSTSDSLLAYADYADNIGVKRVGGAIFETVLDITHPIGYGYRENKVPVFRNSATVVSKHRNPYATPLFYTGSPLLSGFISEQNLGAVSNSASVLVDNLGRGKVVSFVDNPNFRAFWFGTNKMFMNAIFFGNTITHGTAQ